MSSALDAAVNETIYHSKLIFKHLQASFPLTSSCQVQISWFTCRFSSLAESGRLDWLTSWRRNTRSTWTLLLFWSLHVFCSFFTMTYFWLFSFIPETQILPLKLSQFPTNSINVHIPVGTGTELFILGHISVASQSLLALIVNIISCFLLFKRTKLSNFQSVCSLESRVNVCQTLCYNNLTSFTST